MDASVPAAAARNDSPCTTVYRTIGFEKPVDDIVLLCWDCNADLHARGKNKRLNRDDIPFVDPNWATWLEQKAPPQEEETGADDYPEPHHFLIILRDDAGKQVEFLSPLWNPNDLEDQIARLMEIYDLTEVVSTEDIGVWSEDLLARARNKARKS
jgi:hypothetical protein